MMTIDKVMKSVNSKVLVQQIVTFTEEVMLSSGSIWADEGERAMMAKMVEEYLEDLATDDGTIEQYKVVCDRRNNKAANCLKGLFKFDIYFRQKNCLNTTKILYSINVNPNSDMLIPDFII